MGDNRKVRFSRDGDQFHYLWAARRCLRLLSAKDGLTAITIEDPSPDEIQNGGAAEAGDEEIDVGEYYGSEALKKATRVRYIQLKHSTQNPTQPWPPSGLEKTIRRFSERYRELQRRFAEGGFTTPVEFCFISNRPISTNFKEAIEDAASGNASRHPNTLRKLEEFTSLNGEYLSAFCKLLSLEGEADGYWLQRADLVRETSAYLPGNDVDAPVHLKELVTRKALSESASNPSITKMDVLRVLRVDERDLFPAPSRIDATQDAIARSQETDLVDQIVSAKSPIVIHAHGGVGKSVLSQRISHHLPEGSTAVVYDCFGNGEYRRRGSLRHRHKDALIQIANELAARRLCYPLIPSSNADETDYMRAFSHRLRQSIAAVRSKNTQALLCVIVDAADNAELAAKEFDSGHSFARDLLRESLPEGTRLVVLCRTERQDLLDPPARALRLELEPFSRDETASFLRNTHAHASDSDIEEFHKLTSQNPRVQAIALGQSISLAAVLRSLGPNPTTVDDTIAALLRKAVEDLRDTVGGGEQEKIDLICEALATLRPFVPLKVLAAVSGLEAAAVRSFASDLGRPLLIREDAIQFRDEPVETWFRERFSPSKERLSEFIEKLRPFARDSAYVASTLPQLMFEGGKLGELINLALSSSLLPTNLIEKRDVELQRLQFALKASLQAERFADAAKLSLKAAQETTGNTRQQALLRENTDLAAKFLEPERIQEIVARRILEDRDGITQQQAAEKTWTGSHHAYEASLLSYHPDFHGDARSRLRTAYHWLANWSRLPEDERKREQVAEEDIAELALAHFNVHGAERCAAELRGWRPREVSYSAGRIVVRRLIDHKRYDDIDRLAFATRNNFYLLLAISLELQAVHRHPPPQTIGRALRLVMSKRVQVSKSDLGDGETVLPSITALIESALAYQLKSDNVLASVLRSHLPESPPRGLASRFSRQHSPHLRTYALHAALTGEDLQLIDLAHSELKERFETSGASHSSNELQEFKKRIGSLLPWYKLWAKNSLSPIDPAYLAAAITETCQASNSAARDFYQDRSNTSDEIAKLWFEILTRSGEIDETALEEFKAWLEDLNHPLYVPTWKRLAKLAVHTSSSGDLAYEFVRRAFERIKDAKEEADSKAQTYIGLARTILAADQSEAKEYFNKAIEVTSKTGDEIVDRWSAILDLSDRAANPEQPCSKTAYRLARRAELAYQYVYRDKHFLWDHTVEAIAALCPSSCFAILSRWRDRDFGVSNRLIAYANDFLLRRRLIDPKTAAAFIGFRAHWDFGPYVSLLLAACPTHSDREEALNFVLRYMRLDDQSESTWKHLKKVAGEYSLAIHEIDSLIELATRRRATAHETTGSDGERGPRNNGRDQSKWDSVFLGLDVQLHTAYGLSRAYANFRSNEPPFDHEGFFTELFKRIPTVNAVQVIQAFPDVAEFNGYDFGHFLEQMPENWRQREAVKSSIASTTRVLCRRYCMRIVRDRYWEFTYWPLPIHLASKLSGTSEADLTLDIIAAIGKRSETLDARRLFTLVGLLASRLSHDEARDALNFGLDLFNDALDENDGDGSWTAALAPPPDINSAIAGYIWAALSAPQDNLRWEAAHVVRGLCALEGRTVLDRLVEFASNGTGGPFADYRLHFYHRHGRQWLMIALARAAIENPAVLAPYWEFFVHFALKDEPHVVIRHFAAMIALTLVQSGNIITEGKEEITAKLVSVNDSKLPTVSSPQHQRVPHDSTERSQAPRFRFHHDMTWYWFESLAKNFAQSVPYIEHQMEKTICDDWQLSQHGDWGSDERNRRKIFRNRETWHSHGSYPRTDDLRFYLGYHAMMVVAGKQLETVPRHQDPNEPENEFSRWLGWHLLSREDGYWLADRRDAAPLEWPSWRDEKQEEDWRSSVKRSDYGRVLGIGGNRWNLWGSWQAVSGRREESVYITSALVASDRSFALLRALQTANDSRDFRIPDAGDELEINDSGFRLQGWIESLDSEKGRDEVDPWAGAIRYPPLKPAAFVRDLLQLKEDKECRVWQAETEGVRKEVLWSQIWSDGESKDGQYYETEGEYGRRLQASHEFIVELLGRVRMDLIVKVEIERRLLRHRGERSGDQSPGYLPPDHKIFLLRDDGRTYAL